MRIQVFPQTRWLSAFLAIILLGISYPSAYGQTAKPTSETGDSKATTKRPTETRPSSAKKSVAPDVIVVAEDAPWLAAVATPVAGQCRRNGRVPLLIAVDSPPSRRANWLISRAGCRRAAVLAIHESVHLGPVLSSLSSDVLPVGIDPVFGSVAVAKRFWQQARQVVVAMDDDPEAVLLGALVAETMSAPLLIRPRSDTRTALASDLEGLGMEEVLVATTTTKRLPRYDRKLDLRMTVLDGKAIQDRLIPRLGIENVRTIVLARIPDLTTRVGVSAWLAPYLSIARGAPLVLCRTSSATTAEDEVRRFLEQYRLRPRTITILADYASIGTDLVELDATPAPAPPARTTARPDTSAAGNATAVPTATPTAGSPATSPVAPSTPPPPPESKKTYQVQREPCVPARRDQIAAFGVGRIPMESLGGASVMFARGLVRERTLSSRPTKILMVANSSLDRKPLPLCEVISRATAQEFKNFKLPLEEFYGKLADSPEVLAAARDASLILYEGHLAYQDLIYVPWGPVHVPDEYYEETLDILENWSAERPGSAADEVPLPAPTAPGAQPPSTPIPTPEAALPPLPPPPRTPSRLEEPLAELPIVILQSCHSLDDQLLEQIDELGCSAVIGSFTPIHSGSGSILMQAFTDALLYQGANVGEALRDSQNYLFCLQELKVQRGLKEINKSRRVALSFRLWGDPELPVFGDIAARPRGRPVSATWTGADELTIRIPGSRFPEVQSARYSARLYPGSQGAGLVKKREGTTLRQVLPSYFFRVPAPKDLVDPGPSKEPKELAPSDARKGSGVQTAYRIDPLGRFLYLVHFPNVERPGDSIALRFAPNGLVKSLPAATPSKSKSGTK